MTIELPPQYDPKSVEKAIYQKWLEAGVFHAVPDARGPEQRFSVVIPPPNVTGALHLGHAINGTIQDILTRYHRMKGDNTLWMPGIDHAGIATQAVVEKTIFEKEKKSRHDLGREELVRRIWEWKEQFGTRILAQLASMGASCDWERTRFTLDDVCARAVREAFFKMFKDGLIFRGKRLVNWDTHLQTAVADDEIYHEAVKGQMTSIKYPVATDESENRRIGESEIPGFAVSPFRPLSDSEFLIVATTRPETMLGDTAVAVHPDDPRYKHLIGRHVIVPLVGRRIPIVADGQLVDPKFGTGVVKVTPAHDPNDYATGQRHGLEQINLLTADGKVNENGAGEFIGKTYSYVGLKFATAARKAVLADLEGLGLIAEVKVHEHEVGHSDRSKTPIEPFLSDQWFVRMGDGEETRNTKHETRNDEGAGGPPEGGTPAGGAGITLANGVKVSGLAQAAMDAVTSGRVKITPERYAKGYLDWLGQKRDWCISRQLWWGHRIPVWSTGAIDVAERDRLIVSLDSSMPMDPAIDIRQYKSEDGWHVIVCIKDGNDPIIKILEGMGFVQDPDVLDTWFSSALWPLSTMGWPNSGTSKKPEDQLLPYFYPTAVLSTVRDILTLWVARMVMFGLYCRGEVPFKDVFIHPVIQDGEGRIMSKTKGNGLDPVDIINSHGADALRFTLASMSTETQDIRMPIQLVCPHCEQRFPNPQFRNDDVIKCPKCKGTLTRPMGYTPTIDAPLGQTTSEKFDIGRNFANKIWNASRFILSKLGDEMPIADGSPSHQDTKAPRISEGLPLEDRWILSRLHSTIGATEAAINGYRFAELAEALRGFFWTDLCDWYLEIAKGRIKAGDAGVKAILRECLETTLKLLHPMMPFITEEIWGRLRETQGIAVPGLGGATKGAGKATEMLVTAPWPTFDERQIDRAAESQLALIQSVTSAIREIQNRYPAAKGKDVILQPRDTATQQVLEASRGIIESLANAKIAENSPTAGKPENAATAVLPEVQIYIAGVIEKGAETAKLSKRKAELEKLVISSRNKLGNEAFVAKAPAHIIQGLRDQMAKYEEELAAIEKNLVELQ